VRDDEGVGEMVASDFIVAESAECSGGEGGTRDRDDDVTCERGESELRSGDN
jgi:hypothetical protein